MRITRRVGGLVAAAGAAALVVPLLAAGPAQAAGTADLSITKTVADIGPVLQFNPAWSATRSTGHLEWTIGGLHIWTEGSTSTDKVAEYVSTSTPLADVGTPSLEYTKVLPASGNPQLNIPGFQLVVDLDGNGSKDGILVGETVYNGNWWLADIQASAPSLAGAPGPANGYSQSGTLPAWRTAFPDANVIGYGFSLGSGVFGDGYLTGINFANTHYDLRRDYRPTLKAAPGETVEYKIAIANSGDVTDTATGIKITDVLPADVTYVPGSLSRPDWCTVNGQTLTCTGGILPPGTSSNVYLQAKISDTVSSSGLHPTIGHNVDVQKQEVFADLTPNRTRSFTALCPTGYVATDGGLLLDAVDQGGYYSDIVVMKSRPTVVGGIQGWTVTVSNLDDYRGQGKAKVTCLDASIGSSNGHTHDIDVVDSSGAASLLPGASNPTHGETVTVTCPAGYTPIAPQHDVTSGIAVIRSSIADGSSWKWIVDHEAGTAATFDADCLAPETKPSQGHTATLPLNTALSTISVGAESRDEGVKGCDSNGHAITGGYHGGDGAVLSLGKEARGTNYMFRFYNEDWAQAWGADIQVTCVGVRTADEPKYYHVVNTATVSMVGAGAPADLSSHDNTSSADISIVGDAVQPAADVLVGPNGSRTGAVPNVRRVNLQITCVSACSFTVKVLKGGVVVAKATKSFAGSPNPRTVQVRTTSAGRSLANNDVVSVKVKTASGTTTTSVKL